jgi:uncharacterized protein (DUF1499 family)
MCDPGCFGLVLFWGPTMGILDWLKRNWADTDEAGATVAPLDVPWPPAEGLARIETGIRQLPRWEIVSVDQASFTVKATRATRLWRFVDDVTLRLEPHGGGSRIHGRSQSRVGKGDFGQNRRNLLQLFRALGEKSA